MMRLTIHLGHLLWQTLQLLGGAPWWKEEIFHGERSPKTWGNNLFYFFSHHIFRKTTCFTFFILWHSFFGEKSDVEEAKRHFLGGIWERNIAPSLFGWLEEFINFGCLDIGYQSDVGCSQKSIAFLAICCWLNQNPWVLEIQTCYWFSTSGFSIFRNPLQLWFDPKNPTCVKSHFFQGENTILCLEILCRTSSDVARPQDASSAAKLGAAQGPGGVPLRALRLQVGRQRWVNSLLKVAMSWQKLLASQNPGWTSLDSQRWYPLRMISIILIQNHKIPPIVKQWWAHHLLGYQENLLRTTFGGFLEIGIPSRHHGFQYSWASIWMTWSTPQASTWIPSRGRSCRTLRRHSKQELQTGWSWETMGLGNTTGW